jgi:hypothetical protein
MAAASGYLCGIGSGDDTLADLQCGVEEADQQAGEAGAEPRGQSNSSPVR